MDITEVRIHLVEGDDRVLAYCSVVLDRELIMHDLRIIDDEKGPFLAMPHRRMKDRCPQCGFGNSYISKYCSECGKELGRRNPPTNYRGKAKLYRDVVHPISKDFRDYLEEEVMDEYYAVVEQKKENTGRRRVEQEKNEEDIK